MGYERKWVDDLPPEHPWNTDPSGYFLMLAIGLILLIIYIGISI